VPTKRKSLNLKIVESNLAEAIEELEKLRKLASDGTLKEGAFQVGLLHAYHHLNFAWNIRRVETRDYMNLSQKQFERWGKYPSNIEML
jgi:hypothetical protein